jgi:8-oxo-dGTP diphosphatase
MHPQRFPLTQKARLHDAHGRVLLLRDAATGTWDLPGGRLEPGELPDPRAALYRELREEVGEMQVTVDGSPVALFPHAMADGSEALMLLWCGTVTGTPSLSPEHDAWCWWTPSEDASPTAPALRAALGLPSDVAWRYGIAVTLGAIART